MGLSSGGGHSNSNSSSGGGEFLFGYLLGNSNKGDNSEFSPVAAIITGAIVIGSIGAAIGICLNENKRTNAVKDNLNTIIAEDINVKAVNSTYFDWIQDDSNYFFKFTGNATNFDGSKIDFFSAKYKVDEAQYYDVVSYIDKNDIKDFDSKALLEKIIKIVESSELVNSTIKENVSTSQSSNEAVSEPIILEVSKPRVAGTVVYYDVAYMEEVKDENGNLGLKTSLVRVSKANSNELIENPNMIFATNKEDLKVVKTRENTIPMNEFSFLQIDGAPELSC